MAKFAIGEQVDNVADNHEGGTVVAFFRQLAAILDTPLTWKDTARSSFSLRKN